MRKARLAILVAAVAVCPALRADGADVKADNSKTQTDNKKKKKVVDKKKDVEAIGDRNVGSGVNFYSLEKEIALGKQLAQEVERQAKLVDDPIISEYINRLGQNLVRNSDSKVPFTIKLIDSEEPNAFALPGGFFFVNSGLVLLAESEAEIAGAMAHEIAHVAARHGTRQATRGQVANIASLPLIFMGGWTGYGVRQLAGLAIPMTFLRFSRGFEREADTYGLQYLLKTGYDPNSFIEFFEKMETLEKKRPGTISKVFRTHPMTQDRIEAAQKDIQQFLPQRSEYVVNTSEFNNVKARLVSMHARRKVDDKDANRPRLRKATTGGTIPVEDKDAKGKPGEKQEEEDRPTLKRR